MAELVELRARQRTFDGAYSRTALTNLGYSIVFLKLFDRRFSRIGLLYTLLSSMLFLMAFARGRHSRHDFSDRYCSDVGRFDGPSFQPSHGRNRKRIFGRPFVTAGWIVVAVSVIVLLVEIALLVLVLRL